MQEPDHQSGTVGGADSTATSRSALLTLATKASLAVVPAYVLLSVYRGPDIPSLYPLLAVLLPGAAVGLWLVRAGRAQAAARLLVAQAFGVVTFLILAEGAQSSHVGAFAPVVVASSLLLSVRSTMVTSLLAILMLLLAAWLNRQGLYGPLAPLFPEVTAPIMHVVFTGGFLSVLIHFFGQTLQALRANQAELKLSQDQLRRAEKMEAMGQLAGGVAHDFNNILTGMLGHIDLLRMRAEELPGGDDLEHDLTALERSTERAANITRQLLTFSRKEVPDLGVANIARTLEESDVILRRLIREDVEFRVISEVRGFVRVTQTALEQILMNLVLNASDAMPRGGAVAVTTAAVTIERPRLVSTGMLQTGAYLCLSVADAGEGIPRARVERVFEPFFTTKPVGKGTGLGLSTVLGIVQRGGGQIGIETAPGEGTTFEVYLPLTDEPQHSEPSIRNLPPEQRAPGLILICEDDATILDVCSQVLVGAGYEVIATAQPALALERGRALGRRLSLLITDVIMPGMSGRDLALALEKELPGLPVLFISGYTGGLLQDLGIDAQDPRLLTKPFTPKDLLVRVRESSESGPTVGSISPPEKRA